MVRIDRTFIKMIRIVKVVKQVNRIRIVSIVHRICLRMVRTITMMVRKETGLAKLVMVLILVRLVLQMEKIALRIVIMI